MANTILYYAALLAVGFLAGDQWREKNWFNVVLCFIVWAALAVLVREY